MNCKLTKNWKIQYWGYVFIGYFIYTIILPLVLGLAVAIIMLAGVKIGGDTSPLGEGTILRLLVKDGSIPGWIYYLYMTSAVGMVVAPILSLFGGISILKLREKGRKIILFAFGVDLICHVAIVFVALSNVYMKNFIWRDFWGTFFFYVFMLIDIAIISYFSKASVKSQLLTNAKIS
jgi:hypothetical protein